MRRHQLNIAKADNPTMSKEPTYVQLSDGSRLKVWMLGDTDPAKPLLIALHGAPGLSSHTEPLEAYSFLAKSCRVLIYDARGSGESDLQPPFTDERWIADIDELRSVLFFFLLPLSFLDKQHTSLLLKLRKSMPYTLTYTS